MSRPQELSNNPWPSPPGRLRAVDRTNDWVALLDEDPDLGEGLEPEMFARARRLLRAPVVSLERRGPGQLERYPRSGFGLLILTGLMGRRVTVAGAHATELLGPGDILRPWENQNDLDSPPPEIDWRVLRPTRLALLGPGITTLIGQRPELLVAFSGRLLHRTRCGAYLHAVSHLARVEEKVLVTLWHLASRWGRVTPRGLGMTLGLTHEVIGEIVGAQRPTITIALAALRGRGILEHGDGGMLTLVGSPEGWDLPRAAMAPAAEDADIRAGAVSPAPGRDDRRRRIPR